MRRDEAYIRLSMIASDEIIASHISQILFSIRDNICHYNPQIGSTHSMAERLRTLSGSDIISSHVQKSLNDIAKSIDEDSFTKCMKPCCERCVHCENYWE